MLMGNVAVFDIGKTNVKLSVATDTGTILDSLTAANHSVAGPPYRHVDAGGLEEWLLASLSALARRYSISAIVTTSHGSLGALVGGDQLLLPIIDYDEEPPPLIDALYHELAGDLEERGGGVMGGFAHLARQLLFFATEWPQTVARADHFLGGPQFWGWRLSGVAAAEFTYYGAQSHLWDVRRRRLTTIVDRQGWRRLLPEPTSAWRRLGPLRPALASRYGLRQGIDVIAGIHDSTANFYRYQQARLADIAVISTGTWIVGLSDAGGRPFKTTEQRICNSDVYGRPLAGALAMGGREFATIAGGSADQRADARLVAALVAAGTMALPSFVGHDGVFPGSALKGRIAGPPVAAPDERRALAVLYVALLTAACLAVIGEEATAVLDGSFVKDPLYPSLVAALRPGRRTLFSVDAYGTAAGAALLAAHETRTEPAPVDLNLAGPVDIPGLAAYAARWSNLASGNPSTEQKAHG
jgi:sugar (pentulose or hexulose) kinase